MRRLVLGIALVFPVLIIPASHAAVPPTEAPSCLGRAPDATEADTRIERARREELRALPAPPRARAEDFFDAAHRERAARYRRGTYATGFTWLGLSLATLAVLGLVRARELGDWAMRLARAHPYRTALLLVGVMVVVPLITTLPLRILDYVHDRNAGLGTNSAVAYTIDVAKKTGFAFVTTALGALAFLFVARKLPRTWPAAAAAGAAAFTFVAVYLLPVVYEPAFNRFTPVGPQTRARVLALAEKVDVHVNDVLVADASRRTSTLNAYVSGIGSTKRVVLYDTLFTPSISCRQLELIVAHELAHEKHQDVRNGAYLSMAGAAAGVLVLWGLLYLAALRRRLGIERAGDPRVVPFLVVFVAGASFLTQPLVNGISRRFEARADRTAIAVTDDPRAAISVEVELAKRNLADLTPNPFITWWFSTHPPTLERIQIALDYDWNRARESR